MKEEAVKLHEYFVYVNTFEDFKLVLDKVNSAGLNSKNWISVADYPRIGYLFIDESDVSLDGCQFLERATPRFQLLPQEYIEMIDTYTSQKKEKMEKLTIDQVYVHVPFIEITKVLLETAKNNEVSYSNFVKNHDYLFSLNDQIEGAYNADGILAHRTEVGVVEFMQLIIGKTKTVTIKLNDKIEAFVSNKGSKITFSFDKQSKEEVSDKMIDELKLFLQHRDPPKFQAGEYCVFPSSDIRRAFAKEIKHSDIRGADIIGTCGSECVLFYESAAGSIWLKKDEEAYKAYEAKATKINMDEFAERLQFKKKLKLFGHDVTKTSESIIKFGCQDVPREKLSELFHVICTQKGEATAMAS